MNATGHNSASGKRLDSWKEIGAFFNRDERTVKRWEADARASGASRSGRRAGLCLYRRAKDLAGKRRTRHLASARWQRWPRMNLTATATVVLPPALAEPDLEAPPSRRVSPLFLVLAALLVATGVFLLARPPWKRSSVPTHAAVHKANPKAEQLYFTGDLLLAQANP